MSTSERGFVALISTLVISTILLTLVISVGIATWFARSDELNSQQLKVADNESQGCIDVGMRLLVSATSPATYTLGTTSVAIDSDHTCVIDAIIHDGIDTRMIVQAQEGNVVRHRLLHIVLIPYVHIVSNASF